MLSRNLHFGRRNGSTMDPHGARNACPFKTCTQPDSTSRNVIPLRNMEATFCKESKWTHNDWPLRVSSKNSRMAWTPKRGLNPKWPRHHLSCVWNKLQQRSARSESTFSATPPCTSTRDAATAFAATHPGNQDHACSTGHGKICVLVFSPCLAKFVFGRVQHFL